MFTRGVFVIPTLVALLSLGYRVEGRAVPHHRRQGEGTLLLKNETLSRATLYPTTNGAGERLILEGYEIDRFGPKLFNLLHPSINGLILRKGSISNVFFKSSTLEALEIYETGLETFDLDDNPYPNLNVLVINRNELSQITTGISNFVGLRQLNLAQNRITHVELDLFKPMRQLRDLDLSVNRIVQIGATKEVGRPALTVRNLWVGYNRLREFNDFPGEFPALETVRLNGNVWSCPWVDQARADIMQNKITVFGADYECTEDRRGGLCCYAEAQSVKEEPDSWDRLVNAVAKGGVGVRYGDTEVFL